MEMNLHTKTALVTGSTKGIGKAIAFELAKEGVNVVINGRKEDEVERMPQYCMTKSMLLSLAKSLSKLTKGTEVTVNTIMPGPTLSENVQQIIDSLYPNKMTFSEKEEAFMLANLPQSEIQRFIRPVEIGRLAAFLCSPYASAFKGSPIRMDGGMVPTIF
ncbi:SDR family NAD(P)-dependent oxidoreductase [Halalkalibacter oceani]|uniref:SDR family NAD(P)-dependent oxidoreductase n=1 Tax=Halalkalibacter oceani TaxID=1653776 RepID=UPI0033945123